MSSKKALPNNNDCRMETKSFGVNSAANACPFGRGN